MKLTLGSLFDGSGGFPLGGVYAGIEPIWASEIEPFPIKVTRKRFPDMKHLGDVSKINGGEIEPVDIITFGSPCQDMSVVGKRAGLDGSRSSLFYEAIRVVKEMREKTNGEYPKYIVWENVKGAFSSNKGEDFRAVLENICGICDETVSVPRPKKGRWLHSGEIMGDGYSVAWRLFDAQYWGVPQRRKRIYLVADLTGGGSGKILFESEGLSRYSAESFRAWQGIAGTAAESTGETGCYSVDGYNSSIDEVAATLCVNCGVSTGRNGVMVLNDQGGNRMDVTEDVTCTLRAESHHPPCVLGDAVSVENHPTDGRAKVCPDKQNMNCVVSLEGNGSRPSHRGDGYNESNTMYTLNATEQHGTEEVEPTIVNDVPPAGFYPQMKAECMCMTEEKSGTLVNGTNPGYKNGVIDCDYIVRRLTPTECAKLQGFPDWWCDDLEIENPTEEDIDWWYEVFETHRKVVTKTKKPKTRKQIAKWLSGRHTDSAEYKMWGNGVALPNVCFVMSGIAWEEENKIGRSF